MSSDLDRRAADSFDPSADEPNRPRSWPWFWPAVLALSFLSYELFAQPGLGAAIACTKFAWDDFRTARWQAARDPKRRRGRALFWLGIAVGLWKAAVTGIAVMFAAAFVEAALRGPRPVIGPPGRPSAAFVAAFLVTFFGFGLSTLATLRAFGLAWRSRIRLWHDSRMHRDRQANHWPPDLRTGQRHNAAGVVLMTALMVTGIVLPAVGFLLSFIALRAARAQWGVALGWGEPLAAALWLVLSLGLPVTMLVTRDIIAARVLARAPAECWPPDEGESDSDHWHNAAHM